MGSFDNRIESYTNMVEDYLKGILPKTKIPPVKLHEAMHYAVMNGGKRIRPLLVYASGEILDIDPEQLTPTAAAIELLHCFSLVHDDLPSMDDDNLRRPLDTRCSLATAEVVVEVVVVEEETNPTTTSEVKISW